MDSVQASLVDLVHGTDFPGLDPRAVSRAARHTLDAVGCGAGGFGSEPARIARRVVDGAGGDRLASGYGMDRRISVEAAGFANATANRYLDFNDFGPSGHPSDMIPAVLAMVEAVGGAGAEAVVGVHLAYEVATRLAEAVPADGGWDQGIYCSLGIAAAQSKVLGLSREQTAHALSLAAVPAVPLRATRFGELSHWKASATGHAAMSATFAVRLAAAGMTGPPEPFEGKDGLLERVWPTFALDTSPASPTAVERASLKRFPACYWGQVPVDLATRLRSAVAVSDIASIEVATCENAWRSIGGGRGDAAEKWRPPTRETADHSLPYLMAAVLIDGELSEAAFAPARLHDPALLAVVDRITVIERADLSDRATRDSCPTELRAGLVDGRELTFAADVPRGHHADPMSDGEVAEKFHELALRALTPPLARALADRLWDLPGLSSLDEVAEIFRKFGRR